ncbi:MAG: tRNA pseudouridine(55) synthase TruB [Firmicutes bacterium]|nr:tRNA pseudouridine(55) synthase TruB [Bacillota bacterium]
MINMHGLIIVNKEKDWTSRDVVNKISKIFDIPKAGHTGTLDPLATGVLVVAVGEGVKLVDSLSNETKEYIAEVECGILTDTLDILGKTLEEKKGFTLEKEKIEEVLNSFLGKSLQEVPLYSSIRVEGKRLYEYARNNEEVTLPKREIEIFSIELLELKEKSFLFKVKVSKGTYIRSLIRDIGTKLSIPCTMKNLTRTKQGIYSIEESNTLEEIEQGKYKLISFYEVLKDYPMVEVDDYIENKIRNGRILENRYEYEKFVYINKNKEVLAIYEVYDKDNTKVKPFKVFNTK